MKKYFIHNGTEQQGPFDLYDLKAKNINKDTPVWYEGLTDWTTAEKIDELKELIHSITPPPFSVIQTPPSFDNVKSDAKQPLLIPKLPKKKNIVGRIIKLVGIIIIVIYGGAIVSNNFNSSDNSYQEKVMTIEEIERTQPTKYLTTDGSYKDSFWGNKINIKCVITNNATVATYKDAVIRVTYYSKTKTALVSKEHTIYETFPPTSTKTVELKVDNYNDVSTLGWEVINATSY